MLLTANVLVKNIIASLDFEFEYWNVKRVYYQHMPILRCTFTPSCQNMKILKMYFMTLSLMNSIGSVQNKVLNSKRKKIHNAPKILLTVPQSLNTIILITPSFFSTVATTYGYL